MSLEAFGDEPWNEPCEGCVELEDVQAELTRLRDLVLRIHRAQVYEGGDKANGVSVELVKAIRDAAAAAREAE